MPLRAATVTLAVLASFAAGCGNEDETAAAGAAQVVATTAQVADLARQVGGERVAVTQLLAPGSDPHDYEPRPDDVKAVAGADLVLASGLGLDAWIDEVVESAGSDAQVVRLGDGAPVKLEAVEHDDGATDPHWWHEPRNVAAAATQVAAALGDAPLAGAYRREVERVSAGIRRCLGAVPAARRRLVTDHDAFAYFAAAYDVEVVGAVIPSTTSQAQASAGELSRLAATIEREAVAVVFPEAGLSPDLAEALAQRTGAEVGGALYADALGEPGGPAGTVLGAAAANADTLVRGFTGGERTCPISP